MDLFDYMSLLSKVIILPVFAAIVGAAIKGRLEDRRLFKLQDARKVSGEWVGKLRFPSTRDSPSEVAFFFDEKRVWHVSYWFNPKLVTGHFEIDERD